jgi:hypothetical protein
VRTSVVASVATLVLQACIAPPERASSAGPKDEGIRLIEGVAFVELMAQHGIGLRAKDTLVVWEIDPAWSVNDTEGEE